MALYTAAAAVRGDSSDSADEITPLRAHTNVLSWMRVVLSRCLASKRLENQHLY
jgi:hypothetical protein